MSHYVPTAEQIRFLGDAVADEQIQDFLGGEDYYMSNFTRNRPPHFNNRNIPAAQSSGQTGDPRVALSPQQENGADLIGIMGNIDVGDDETPYHPAHYVPSLSQTSTESTATVTIRDVPSLSSFTSAGGSGAAQVGILIRPHIPFWVNRDYIDGGVAQPLTEAAVGALDNLNGLHSLPIPEWVRGAAAEGFELHERTVEADQRSASIVVSGLAARTMTRTLGSSWSVISSVRSYQSQHHRRVDDMAGDVCAAGWQFDDVPAHPSAWAIRDEDFI